MWHVFRYLHRYQVTDTKLFSTSLAKVTLIIIQRLKAVLRKCTVGPEDRRDAADWSNHLPSAFPEGDSWTKGGRDAAQSLQKAKTLPSRPHDHCFHLRVPLQKWGVIRGHFCQQKACVRVSGSVRLPTGRRDSLHSNYGSALFLRSTLEASVQSQTCTEQHEQERGRWQHRQAQHWCQWLLPHCYWI